MDFPTEGNAVFENQIYPLIMHEGESNVEKDQNKSNLCKGQTFNYSPGKKYKVNADVCPYGITHMGDITFPIDTVGRMIERSGEKFLRYPHPEGATYYDLYFNLNFSAPFLSLLFVPAAVKIREKLGEFVNEMNDFKELDNEDVQQLVIFVQQLEGLSDANKNNLAIAIKGFAKHPAM